MLLIVVSGDRGWNLEFRGIATARQVIIDDKGVAGSDDYQNAQKKVRAWTLEEERELPALLEFMSNNHIGVDINVFRLEKIVHRKPGELVEKKVTKDGVLPA